MLNTLLDEAQIFFFARSIHGYWGTGETEAAALKKAKNAKQSECSLIVITTESLVPIEISIDNIDGSIRNILPEDCVAVKYLHNAG